MILTPASKDLLIDLVLNEGVWTEERRLECLRQAEESADEKREQALRWEAQRLQDRAQALDDLEREVRNGDDGEWLE